MALARRLQLPLAYAILLLLTGRAMGVGTRAGPTRRWGPCRRRLPCAKDLPARSCRYSLPPTPLPMLHHRWARGGMCTVAP